MIISEQDISVARAKRYRLNILVPVSTGQADLVSAIEPLVTQFAQQRQASAVAAFVYDRHEDAGDVYTLASLEYAPNGAWADAVTARAGDYTRHQFVWQVRRKVSDPGSVTRPTERQFVLWDASNALLRAEPDTDEDELVARAATEQGVRPDEIREAAAAVVAWKFH